MEIELEDTDFYPPPPEHNPILAQSDADADGDAEMGEVQEVCYNIFQIGVNGMLIMKIGSNEYRNKKRGCLFAWS